MIGKSFVLAVAVAIMPYAANAGITETTTTSTVVTYNVTGQGPGVQVSLPQSPSNLYHFAVEKLTSGNLFRLNVDLHSVATKDGFEFEHNLFVQGNGKASLSTTVTLTLTNDGDTAQLLRLDSLIDPGHIASRGLGIAQDALFQFQVVQDNTPLFFESGQVTSTDSLPHPRFNGYNTHIVNNGENSYGVGDWSATPVNLNLASIAAHSSSVITYITNTAAYDGNSGATPCKDFNHCHGTQISFGDPLMHGGVVGAAIPADAPLPGSPVIGFQVAPYSVPISIVQQGSPLPTPPALLPPPNYNPPASVPEPATFALFGVGFATLALRRRR